MFKFNPAAEEYNPAEGGAGGLSNRERMQQRIREQFAKSMIERTKENIAKQKAAEKKVQNVKNLPYLEAIEDIERLFDRFSIVKKDDFIKLTSSIIANAESIFYSDKIKRTQFTFIISSHGVSTRDLGFNSKIIFDKEKGNQEIIAYGGHGKSISCHPGLQSQICKKSITNEEIEFVAGKNTRERFSYEFPYDYVLASDTSKGESSFKSGVVLCSEPKNNIVISIDAIGKNILFSQIYDLIHIFVDKYCELSGQKRNEVNSKVHLLFCRVSECEFNESCVVNIDPKYIVGGKRSTRRRKTRLRQLSRRHLGAGIRPPLQTPIQCIK